MADAAAKTTDTQKVSEPVRRGAGERPFAGSLSGPQAGILMLQRLAGNRAVGDHMQALRDEAGQSLDPSTRSLMESRFGTTFADVRVHTHAYAGRAAAGVQARAFTLGQDIVFAQGQYAPGTADGRSLLAHELAHVVQQRHAAPALSPAIAPERSGAESTAAAAASQVAAGGMAGPVGNVAVAAVQRAPETDPAKLDSLGPVADFLVDAAAGSGPAKELFAAAMRGFIAEMKTQLVTQKKGEAALNRLQELKSVKNAAIFYAGYVGGLVAGAISPLTGLFDLAVFGEKLQQIRMQLLAQVLKGGGALVEEAKALGVELLSFGKKAVGALKGLKGNPLETIDALFKDLSAAAIKKANEAGHGAAASIIKSFESDFEDKPAESWRDILTRRKEGEAYTQPLGLVNSVIERSKEKVLGTPWARMGYDIGYAVGAVAVNVVLLATTGGVGNAIAEIGTALGKIAPLLGRAAEAVVAIGKAIHAVEEAIALLIKGALKPLQALLRELEPLFLRLRGFLRRLLGLAEDEAGALAGAASKTAAAELGAPKPKPDLKVLGGGGQKVSPPKGKLKLVSSEGKIVPPPEPHVTAVPQAEENLLAATGTEGRVITSGPTQRKPGPIGVVRQEPAVASSGGGGKGTPTSATRGTTTRSTGRGAGAGQKSAAPARTRPAKSGKGAGKTEVTRQPHEKGYAGEVEQVHTAESMEHWKGVDTETLFARHQQNFDSLTKTLKNKQTALGAQGKKQLLPEVDEKILDMPVDYFIENAASQDLKAAWRQLKANPNTRSELAKAFGTSAESIGAGKVGARKPDIVEFFLDKNRVVITDITTDPLSPVHQFKSQFYKETLENILGKKGPKVFAVDINPETKPLPITILHD